MLDLTAIQAPAGSLSWSESHFLSDAEPQLAGKIALAVQRHLGGRLVTAGRAPATSPERFLSPLARVRMHCGADDLLRAAQTYEWLTHSEPEEALSWAGWSICLSLQVWLGFAAPVETELTAKAAAVRALSLSREHAECSTAMGLVKAVYDHSGAEAQNLFLEALARDP